MIIFAISDVVWQACIAAAVTIVLAWLQQRAAKKVSDKVEVVRTDHAIETEATATKLQEMAKVGEKTHALVNSAMLEQKRMHAAKCRAAAEDNPTQENIAEARVAVEVYEEHKAKQEAMEAKG